MGDRARRLSPFQDCLTNSICNFLGSVLPQQKFEAMDRPVLLQLSVTAWLQLNFIWQTKENTSSRLREGQPKRNAEKRERLNFGSSFYVFFFSPPPELALCKLG